MENNSEVVYLYLDDVIPNRFQPREVFDDQALKELAVSIKEHGVIQPIIVRKVENKYEIIDGERRYKASTMAGLTKIPAIVKNLDDKESSKVALIENLQRKDLSPIEEARTYQKILELEDGMTQEQLAATMGKTQSSVSNKLRLLALPEEVQDALLKEKISERHARSLLNVEDKNNQIKMLDKIIAEKMTVRELDKEIREMKEGKEEGDSMNSGMEGNLAYNTNNITSPATESSLTVPINEINSSSIEQSNTNNSLSNVAEYSSAIPISIDNLIPKETNNTNNNQSLSFNLASFGSSNNVTENTDNTETSTGGSTPPLATGVNPTVVDINQIRENSVDIGGQKPSTGENDSVIKEKNEVTNEELKFVPSFNLNSSKATTEPPTNNFSQYFNTNIEANYQNETQNVASTISPLGITIPSSTTTKDVTPAINDLKAVITSLENKGYKVTFEENDNTTEYKITISLQKNA